MKAPLHVRFFHDADVEAVRHEVDGIAAEKLVPLAERGRSDKRNSSRCLSYNGSELPSVQESDEGAKDVYFKPTELLENNENHIRTATVFGFQTPKKRLSMLAKAGSASKTGNTPRTPHTPHSALKSQTGTPRTPTTPKTPGSAQKATLRTPKSKRRLTEASDAPTPYGFRKRVKQRITKMVCDENFSSDDDDSDYKSTSGESDSSDDNNGSEDEEFKENYIETPSKTPKRMLHHGLRSKLSTPKTPSRTSKQAAKIKDVNMVANSEDYFIANGSSKRIATSDHTLSHLKTPRLSADTLQMVLSEVGPSHPEEQKAMMQEHSSYFSRWMTLLW